MRQPTRQRDFNDQLRTGMAMDYVEIETAIKLSEGKNLKISEEMAIQKMKKVISNVDLADLRLALAIRRFEKAELN